MPLMVAQIVQQLVALLKKRGDLTRLAHRKAFIE
jgi:hypothetical protein